MKVLVTGGAGFLGAGLVRRIHETRPEWSVTVVDALLHPSSRARVGDLERWARVIEGNVAHRSLVDMLVRGADLVVHAATESAADLAPEDPWPSVESNVLGTYEVLEAVRRHGRRMHLVSTDEVYGVRSPSDPSRFTAESVLSPSGAYAASKASADLLTQSWVRGYGLPATITRRATAYGPGQGRRGFIAGLVTDVLLGVRPVLEGHGVRVHDWIHVDDHSDGVLAVVDRGRPGFPYLLAGGAAMSERRLLDLVLDVAGRPPDWFELAGDPAAHRGRCVIDPSAVRDELGWSPRYADLRSGVEETFDWYRSHEASWRAPDDEG